MREIKFRAWNTRRKEMELCQDLYWFEEHYVHENSDNDYIILQYTGLKDKNGKEIYEGDIMTRSCDCDYGCNMHPAVVDFQCGGFYLNDEDLYGNHYKNSVIGNIYENKEYLEDNNG